MKFVTYNGVFSVPVISDRPHSVSTSALRKRGAVTQKLDLKAAYAH